MDESEIPDDLIEVVREARAQAPSYDELEWDNPQVLYQQMTTLAMATGWHPMRDVMILPRIAGGGQTLAYIDCPTTIDNESVIVGILRDIQASMGEQGVVYAMWLHAFTPGTTETTTVAIWCGVEPSKIVHFNITGDPT